MLFLPCDAADLTIVAKLPSHRYRTAESRIELTIAGVALVLHLHGLPAHMAALWRSCGQWRATTTVAVCSIAQNSTFHPVVLPQHAPPSPLEHRVVAVEARLCLLVRDAATFFERVYHSRCANPQHSCRIRNATAVECHVADLLLHLLEPDSVAQM